MKTWFYVEPSYFDINPYNYVTSILFYVHFKF